jgi:hypothetical protein
MFIKFNPKTAHVKTIPLIPNGTALSFTNDSVILKPGTNEITDQEWEAIQPHIKAEIASKVIVAFTVPVQAKGKHGKAGTLKDVPLSTARKIIEGCQNTADLKKWVKQELPDEILLIVLKRLRKLRVDPDEIVDDDEQDDSLDDDITLENGEGGPEPKTDSADAVTGDENGEETETTEGDDENAGEGKENGDEGDDEIPDFDGNRQWE